MSWKDRAEDDLKKTGKGSNYKLKQGDNEIRVLPTKKLKKDHDASVYETHRIHPNVGPDKRVVACGKNSSGTGECWLHDKQIPKLLESDSKAKRKQAEAMQDKELFTIQVGYMDGKKMRGPVKLSMNMGGKKSTAWKLLKTITNPKFDCIDPKKGRNISIDRDGEGLATVYGAPVISSEKTKVPSKILKAMKTFEELILPYSESKQKAAYYGKEDSDESSSTSSSSSSKGDKKMARGKKKEESSAVASSSTTSGSASGSAASSSTASSSPASSSTTSSDKKKSSSKSSTASSGSGSARGSASSTASSSSASASASSSTKSSAASSSADTPAKGKGKKGAKAAPKGKGAKGKGKKK
jgi:hypothetical protein